MKKFADTPFLPTEVEIEAISDNEAKISAYPFESGFAITLAHPLEDFFFLARLDTLQSRLKSKELRMSLTH